MAEKHLQGADDTELCNAYKAYDEDAREELGRRFGKGLKRKFLALRKGMGDLSLGFETFLDSVIRAACSAFLKKQRRGPCGSLATHLGRLVLEDLYLATACSLGDERAWKLFDQKYFSYIRNVAQSFVREPALAMEMAGDLYGDLYVREISAVPSKSKIGGYNGSGSLFGWLRVVVFHKAVDVFRDQKGVLSVEEMLEGGQEVKLSPAETAARAGELMEGHENLAIFRAVVCKEMKELSSREKAVLSFYYLEGLTGRELGQMYGVHEATASRWIKKAGNRLRRGIERRLKRKHGFSKEEAMRFLDWACQSKEVDMEALFKKSAS
ncbi:MAG: sigma-70 family RNA polymerase sigma factor [Thermodesulfobacteriota bacterium]|nr:sigma-70 family RNA polymerase sigma factor [Thermodesulfobacteriota bacterium]